MQFEAPIPNMPVLAIEIKSHKPDDWSPLLLEVWGEAMNDPAEWAKKAEAAGADLIVLALTLDDTPETRRQGRQGCPGRDRPAPDRLGTGSGRKRQ